MKKYLIIILLFLVSCQKEKPKEDFDYITFTPMNSAIVKITDFSKYKLELTTEIEGKIENYDFYTKNDNEIFKKLLSGEVIFYINVEEEKNRISITYSMRKQGSNAQGHSIMYVPIKGKLKESGGDYSKTLNFTFTLLDGEKKNLFKFRAIKIKSTEPES